MRGVVQGSMINLNVFTGWGRKVPGFPKLRKKCDMGMMLLLGFRGSQSAPPKFLFADMWNGNKAQHLANEACIHAYD